MSLATFQLDEDFLPALARSDNEVFYNPARRKSHLGSVSQEDFEHASSYGQR